MALESALIRVELNGRVLACGSVLTAGNVFCGGRGRGWRAETVPNIPLPARITKTPINTQSF